MQKVFPMEHLSVHATATLWVGLMGYGSVAQMATSLADLSETYSVPLKVYNWASLSVSW
jgi:hypothetical protein